MNLISWSPFRELDSLFERYGNELALGRPRPTGQAGQEMEWRPSADITENDNEYVVKAHLPEVKRDDIDIKVESGVLKLSGERRLEKSVENEKEHRREMFYGRFARSFSIPDDVDVDKIAAECKDGVLTVRLPKSEDKKPREIKVQVH